MMSIMPVAQDGSTMTMHDDVRQGHVQSTDVSSHIQMLQSGDHPSSHDMSCELICAVSISLLPHIDSVRQEFYLTQLWTVPQPSDYLFDLHTQLYKPPRI
jgi:hypothetical protein